MAPRRSARNGAGKSVKEEEDKHVEIISDGEDVSEEEQPKTRRPPSKKRKIDEEKISVLESSTKAPTKQTGRQTAVRRSSRHSSGQENGQEEENAIVLSSDNDTDEEKVKNEPVDVDMQQPEAKPKRRGRPPAVKKEENVEQVASKAKKTKQAAQKEEDVKDEDDFVDVKDLPKRRTKSPAVKKEKKAKLDDDGGLLSENDISDDEPIQKRSTKRAPLPKKSSTALGKRKAAPKKQASKGRKGKPQAKDSDESSDFVASESESSEDDEEDDWGNEKLKQKAAQGKDLVDGSSDDEDDKPIKAAGSKRKPATPKKQAKKAPTPRKVEKASPSKARENDDNDDGNNGPTEEREYPYYEVTYSTSGRARCKTCEKTLGKGELVVSIQLVHSRFGLATYYKHLKCAYLNNDVPMELHGLSALEPDDVKRVQDHLLENSKNGIDDERVPLSDEHFIKRDILPAAKPSPLLTASLLPYQQEGLAWMKAQEASKYRGGILADEMGMGKTIQAISLLLENVKVKRSKGMLMGGGTLIICPVIACMQWKSEIERFVEANHLSILVYHGPKRTNLASHIASYDIVLTTYSILESEGRKLMQAEKVPCQYCKKLFVPEKLVAHNKYFCGPDARKTAKQAKQKTTKGKAATKAKKLSDDESESEEDDVPLKKAKTSVPPPSRKQTSKPKSALHEIEWTRVILDEAHYIKDKKCSTARSVFRLNSLYRWCLTGTPLQNRIGELFSLVRFLQVDPFAYYECVQCDCKQLDFSIQQGHCKHCEHTAMQHYSPFNKKIVIPIQGYGYVAEGKLAMLRLQNDLLRHVLLRRTKQSRADDISLPPKLVRVRRDALDEREKDFYESIYTQSKAQFNTYVSAGTLLNNYAHIFDLLIRLRQAVDHPYLVIYSNSNPALQVPKPEIPAVEDLPLVALSSNEDTSNPNSDELCGFCREPIEQPIQSSCSHEFCRSCVEEYIESLLMGAQALCPTCEEPLTVDLSGSKEEDPTQIQEAEKEADAAILKKRHAGKLSLLRKLPSLGDFQSSTKIEALMEELNIMKQHDPSAKAIVFSQFVNMLDLIEHRLHLAGIKCVKLSGHMQMAHRDRLLTEFRQDPTITVFLISLKAGGVALNLTVASHIFLMDPWWNPAAEHQAIDRTHRLGQFKPIRATRFVIANTIEERILKLQEKKQLVFEGTVGSSTAALARLTIEDLRFLFSG